jgi:hypothetical protein
VPVAFELLAHGAGHAGEGRGDLVFTAGLVITMVVVGVASMVRSYRRHDDDVP